MENKDADTKRDRQETNQETNGRDTRIHNPLYTESRKYWQEFLEGKITSDELQGYLKKLQGEPEMSEREFLTRDIFEVE